MDNHPQNMRVLHIAEIFSLYGTFFIDHSDNKRIPDLIKEKGNHGRKH